MTEFTNAKKLLNDSAEGIVWFYLQREQKTGGFSAGRYMPATVEDTYHAVRCLFELDRFLQGTDVDHWEFPGEIDISSHMEFISLRLQQDWNNSKRLYELLFCADKLSLASDSSEKWHVSLDSIVTFINDRIKTVHAPDETFYGIRTLRMIKKSMDSFSNCSSFCEHDARSVKELRMYLYLAQNCGDTAKASLSGTWRSWLEKCRNFDGGYGFFPGTTSYTENIYHALESYRLLGTKPACMEETTGFLRGCRSKRGGFGRRSQGIPFPDSTWYAAGSLINLSLMAAKSKQFNMYNVKTKQGGSND